jgi:two-component system LytT family response regulator
MLRSHAEVEVIGECADGREAIEAITERQPDLVFLDVQMPELSGFDVLRAIPPEKMPGVVFVTAHEQHAVEAFEVHAIDYLLKPFRKARFEAALQRAWRNLKSADSTELNRRLLEWLEAGETRPTRVSRLAVRSGDRTSFVRVTDIDYVESAANYVVIHACGENHILRDTLTHLETILPPQQFLRISRFAIVNLERVKELQPALRGEHVVILRDGKQLSLTRSVREVQARLQYL